MGKIAANAAFLLLVGATMLGNPVIQDGTETSSDDMPNRDNAAVDQRQDDISDNVLPIAKAGDAPSDRTAPGERLPSVKADSPTAYS